MTTAYYDDIPEDGTEQITREGNLFGETLPYHPPLLDEDMHMTVTCKGIPDRLPTGWEVEGTTYRLKRQPDQQPNDTSRFSRQVKAAENDGWGMGSEECPIERVDVALYPRGGKAKKHRKLGEIQATKQDPGHRPACPKKYSPLQ